MREFLSTINLHFERNYFWTRLFRLIDCPCNCDSGSGPYPSNHLGNSRRKRSCKYKPSTKRTKMTKLKSIVTLVLLLALLPAFSEGTPPNNIPITGSWDVNLPGHFIGTTLIESGEGYAIKNNTSETIYIWLLDDHTPVSYFPLLAGGSQEFTSPGTGFDIYTSGTILIKNVSLRQENEDEDY